MLWYFPIENYPERYSFQLSAPEWGWMERNFKQYGINYERIDGHRGIHQVKTGVALDAVTRVEHCFRQVEKFLYAADNDEVKTGDVVYLDDFWHPGIEAIRYVLDQKGIEVKIYGNLWAQSVDEFDFTYPMRHWMRSFEMGIGNLLSGIFVATPMLKKLVVDGGISLPSKVHAVGHPWSTEEVQSRMPILHTTKRMNTVVYSSRWDSEKNPGFFLQIMEEVLSRRKDIRFIICSSAPQLRSNTPKVLSELANLTREHPNNIFTFTGLSKEAYYEQLKVAKVQMNCASQDWISYTLLEASAAGCYPLYPYFRSFPEVFAGQTQYMYRHLDVKSAADNICRVIDANDLWTNQAITRRQWIHQRFDTSIKRMLIIMGLMEGTVDDPFKQS